MPKKIVLSLDRIKASKPWAEKSIEVIPQTKILFELEIGEGQYRINEDNQIVLNRDGLGSLLNGVSYILYIGSEEGDF